MKKFTNISGGMLYVPFLRAVYVTVDYIDAYKSKKKGGYI